MSVCSDKWIRRMAKEKGMIDPFVDGQIKTNADGGRAISYGLSSYGYDLRVSNEFKVIFEDVTLRIMNKYLFERVMFLSLTGSMGPNTSMDAFSLFVNT